MKPHRPPNVGTKTPPHCHPERSEGSAVLLHRRVPHPQVSEGAGFDFSSVFPECPTPARAVPRFGEGVPSGRPCPISTRPQTSRLLGRILIITSLLRCLFTSIFHVPFEHPSPIPNIPTYLQNII